MSRCCHSCLVIGTRHLRSPSVDTSKRCCMLPASFLCIFPASVPLLQPQSETVRCCTISSCVQSYPSLEPRNSAWHLSYCLYVHLPSMLDSLQPSCVLHGCRLSFFFALCLPARHVSLFLNVRRFYLCGFSGPLAVCSLRTAAKRHCFDKHTHWNHITRNKQGNRQRFNNIRTKLGGAAAVVHPHDDSFAPKLVAQCHEARAYSVLNTILPKTNPWRPPIFTMTADSRDP